jgi:hypothetical protein
MLCRRFFVFQAANQTPFCSELPAFHTGNIMAKSLSLSQRRKGAEALRDFLF